MGEFKINIAPEKEQLIKMLVEELGGEVIEDPVQSAKTKKSAPKKQAKDKKPSPTFLFGKWKDFDIDPRELRAATWGRKF